jgi:hypothetical protein
MHHDAYLQEQRWPHESFWRRRHSPTPNRHRTELGHPTNCWARLPVGPI